MMEAGVNKPLVSILILVFWAPRSKSLFAHCFIIPASVCSGDFCW